MDGSWKKDRKTKVDARHDKFCHECGEKIDGPWVMGTRRNAGGYRIRVLLCGPCGAADDEDDDKEL